MVKRILTLGVMLSICAAVYAQEATYEIRLHRPSAAGRKYRLEVQVKREDTPIRQSAEDTTEGGTTSFEVELISDVTVLAVDSVGHPMKESHRIAKCTWTEEGQTESLLAEGTEVVAAADGDHAVFTVDGERLSRKAYAALSEAVNVIDEAVTDDDVFGTKDAVGTGQSWPVNAELIAREFSEDINSQVAAEDVKGMVTLKKVIEREGIPCLEVAGDMSLEATPQRDSGRKWRFEWEFSGVFPVDYALPVLEETVKRTTALIAKGKDGPEAADFTVMQTSTFRHATLTPRE